MNRYYADLHIHSRYSRATSPQCTPEGLHHWAQIKGVGVCGTGDCTHPQWLAELQAKLIEDAPGLYALRPELLPAADEGVPESCRRPARFMVTGEISSIYKRAGRVRKVHSLILLPSLDAAAKLNRRLDQIGNIRSDGRPILGLDPRDLLEIMLETDPLAALIPAHIWTPWFSMLGAKSGFDSLDECFGALSRHIFAVETGLSSDVPMNRRVRCLDRLALVSNSDLHSPANLGRNANLFFGEPSYHSIINGLRSRDPSVCGGTVDLFPEEGKYHLDGHRACKTRLTPEQSMALGNICPVCGKEVTIGVLHRVVELERMQKAEIRGRKSEVRDQRAEVRGNISTTLELPNFRTSELPPRLPYRYIIPLPELLAQQLDVGTASKKVRAAYLSLLSAKGSELPFLLDTPAIDLENMGVIGQAVLAVRQGRVERVGGYDGEYGRVMPISHQPPSG
ncbi:MAG: endonuclease Q family protein [Kiritimatiellae bacterium]|nr:endonuclease Q family protein [Kiritimatiellia bacterium]MDD4025443.1 endonuclease Q family protein [Kiritimatiellia bacterium]MDD4621657.1 endonuclease Q family protein [Kiritimatiellia bacterium]